jgi:hypothetical protein
LLNVVFFVCFFNENILIYENLKDELWGKAALLKEANAISVELKKKVKFNY